MKTLNVIGVIVAVAVTIIIALAGIATIVAATAASLLLVQSVSATTDDVMTSTTSVGGEQEEAVSGTATTTTTNNVSNALLGRLFSFGEDLESNVNPINETYIVISYLGNRIILPPNATDVVINATEIGNVTINIQPNGLSFNQGQAVIMTEDGAATEEEQ
jgi:hypothetical protein